MAAAAQPAAQQRVSHLAMLWMNIYWLSHALHWGALMGVLMQSQVAKYSLNKATGLAQVIAAGTFIAVIVHPLAGALSDRIHSRLGKRRPFLLWWTIPNLLGLVAMAFARNVLTMTILYAVIQFANNFANAPWAAVIADKVPHEQRGTASGYYGLMTVIGNALGIGIFGRLIDKTAADAVYIQQLYLCYALIIGAMMLCVLLSVLLVKEEPATGGPPLRRSELRDLYWISPKQYPDLFWVYLTRFLYGMGVYGVYNFLQYYFDDVMHLPGERTFSNFGIALLGASVLTVWVGGWLSDRIGRKKMVYLAGGLQTIVCLAFVLVAHPWIIIPGALIFGVGYGAYQSVDNALAIDVLPNPEEFGKHMAAWQVAGILPQVIGIIVGGLLLNATHGSGNLGYTLLFLASVIFFGLSTVFIYRVRRVD